MSTEWKTRATLTLVVEYEDHGSVHEHCQELIELARAYGWPKKATLEIAVPSQEELI